MSYRSLILTDNPSLYWVLNDVDGAADLSGNARHGSPTSTFNTGAYPVTPAADYTSLFTPRHPLLHDTYAGKGSTALTAADTGQGWDTSQFTNDANTRMSIVSDRLTNTTNSGTDARAYSQANIGPATRLGARYTFTSGNNGGVMAILAGKYIDLNNRYPSPSNPDGWTFNVHWTVDPDSWEFVFVYQGIFYPALTGTHSLVKDDATVYTSALVLSGTSAWILLPDGSYRLVTNTAIDTTKGDWVVFEVTQGTPATDTRVKFTEVWADGFPVEIDSSTDLNGVDSGYLTTYNPFTIGSQRTFECWAWRDSSANGSAMFGNSVGLFAGNFIFRVSAGSNQVEFYLNFTGGAPAGVWPTAWPGLNQWVHVALVVDDAANNSELYINGVSQGGQTFGSPTTSWAASPGTLTVGHWLTTGADWFDGKLSHVAAYERALTASEIKAHYGAMQVDAQIQPGYLTAAGRGQ